jgi:hypothetical protein
MVIDQPCRRDPILSRPTQSWHLRTSVGHEESCCFRTFVLPGPSSSAPGGSINEEDLCGIPEPLGANGNRNRNPSGILKGSNLSVVSALVSTSRLSRFLALVSSISTSPPAFLDRPPHVIKVTRNKGLGMFARRDVQKGELIVWERPALIVPGLERNEDTSKEAYRSLAEGFCAVEGEGIDGAMQLGSVEDVREAGKERYEDVRRMAISSSFDGGHWVEGVVRTNALVLEFEDGQKKNKEEKREIYGGVYPLINRCNHRLVLRCFFFR